VKNGSSTVDHFQKVPGPIGVKFPEQMKALKDLTFRGERGGAMQVRLYLCPWDINEHVAAISAAPGPS